MSAPILIVSAGGVGCRVAAMVAAHTSPAQRENLCFVALDTDANDLRALRARFGQPGEPRGFEGDAPGPLIRLRPLPHRPPASPR